MNLWTLGAQRAGTLRIPQGAFSRACQLRVVLAYDVRQFEDKRNIYNPRLPNPVLHLSAESSASMPPASTPPTAFTRIILPADSKRYLATPELSFTIRYLKAHGGLNMSGVAQSAGRQRRQVLRRARRPAGAARRPDHGRPRRSGDDDQSLSLGRRGEARARSTSSMKPRTRRTSTCAGSRV